MMDEHKLEKEKVMNTINVHFINCTCKEDACEKIQKLYKSAIRDLAGIKSEETVIIPWMATADNIYAYNHWMKDYVNPRSPSDGKRKYKVGDAVIQTINNAYIPCARVTNTLQDLVARPFNLTLREPANSSYDLFSTRYTHFGVYACEKGTVVAVDAEREILRVYFDAGYIADYRFGPEVQMLDFAYATSLNRLEGRTCKAIIFDAWEMEEMYMTNPLLAKLIASAEKEVYILGDNISLDEIKSKMSAIPEIRNRINVDENHICFPIY